MRLIFSDKMSSLVKHQFVFDIKQRFFVYIYIAIHAKIKYFFDTDIIYTYILVDLSSTELN